jgi:hypothetical protein
MYGSTSEDRSDFADPDLSESVVAPQRRTVRTVVLVAVSLIGVLVLAAGGALYWIHLKTMPTPYVSTQADTTPRTAQGRAQLVLDAQAKALVAGDERSWLSAVDPAATATVSFFRQRFTTMRGLDVSQFLYSLEVGQTLLAPTTASFTTDVYAGACFSATVCPPPDNTTTGSTRPAYHEKVTFKLVGGKYLISKVASAGAHWASGQLPWQSNDLVIAKGSRAIVAAAPKVTKRLKEALADADRSAATVDKFATLMNNRQGRYRIFLADDKTWKTWFGGILEPYTIGAAYSLGYVQSEIVLKMSDAGSAADLANTIQHEMGHVASLGSINADGGMRETNAEKWVKEGFAEYVAYYPESATASERRSEVHQLMHGSHRPKNTLDFEAKDGTALQVSQFYGYSHFAIDCLAQKYGLDKMIKFATDAMRHNQSTAAAMQDAFGLPQKTVETACEAWISQKA